jgi:hypothetical protein
MLLLLGRSQAFRTDVALDDAKDAAAVASEVKAAADMAAGRLRVRSLLLESRKMERSDRLVG